MTTTKGTTVTSTSTDPAAELSPSEASTTPPGPPPHDPQDANREAARWRTQLRESQAAAAAQLQESQATAAAQQTRIDGLLRGEVDRLVSSVLAEPADLFEIGQVELAELLDASGNV